MSRYCSLSLPPKIERERAKERECVCVRACTAKNEVTRLRDCVVVQCPGSVCVCVCSDRCRPEQLYKG